MSAIVWFKQPFLVSFIPTNYFVCIVTYEGRGGLGVQTCEMYPGGTWMGGIDPFGDIMGTSAGPAGEEEKYLFKGKFSFTSISQQHTCGDTNTAWQMLTVSSSQAANSRKQAADDSEQRSGRRMHLGGAHG